MVTVNHCRQPNLLVDLIHTLKVSLCCPFASKDDVLDSLAMRINQPASLTYHLLQSKTLCLWNHEIDKSCSNVSQNTKQDVCPVCDAL